MPTERQTEMFWGLFYGDNDTPGLTMPEWADLLFSAASNAEGIDLAQGMIDLRLIDHDELYPWDDHN
ncbi:hypothetical protein PG991_012141 [Apiospora marii]|uniref:Uncharacterized protein n=1 Tax=Apiospora marii TaxID=335849 RepID=A0ABR1R9W6_9PEZI